MNSGRADSPGRPPPEAEAVDGGFDAAAWMETGAWARVGGSVVRGGAVLGTAALAVRTFGTSDYGVLAFSLAAAGLASGVGRLGLEPGVTRVVAMLSAGPDARRATEFVRGAAALGLLGGVASLAITLALVWAGTPQDVSIRLALGLGVGLLAVANNLAVVAGAVARGVGRFVLSEATSCGGAVGRFAVVALIAVTGASGLELVGVGYGLTGALLVTGSLIVARGVMGGDTPRPSLLEARRALPVVLPFAVTGIGALALSRFDVLVLGLARPAREVGSYEPTLRLVEALLVAQMALVGPFLPTATRLLRMGAVDSVRELYLGASKLACVIGLPAAIALAAFPEPILRALFGASFDVRPRLVWLLLPGFAASLALGLNTNALAASGNRRSLIVVGGTTLASMIVLAGVLVPAFGSEGAAAATSVTYAILNGCASIALARHTGIHPFRRDLVLVVASSALPIGAALAVRKGGWDPAFSGAVACSLAVWAAWVVLLVFTRALRPGELRRVLPSALAR